MHHVGRRLHTGLAGDEDHPTVTAFGHPRGVAPRQADAGQHADLEHPPPPVIVDVEGRLGREDAYVVDQDVGTRHAVEDLLRPGTRADICCDAVRSELGRNGVHPRGIQSVHDDFGSRAHEHLCDRFADTGGGARDERDAPCQIDFHVVPPGAFPSCWWEPGRWCRVRAPVSERRRHQRPPYPPRALLPLLSTPTSARWIPAGAVGTVHMTGLRERWPGRRSRAGCYAATPWPSTGTGSTIARAD